MKTLKNSKNIAYKKTIYDYLKILCFSLSPHYIRWKNRNRFMRIKGDKKKVLMCLCEYDYCRPVEIARVTGIHKNTVSNILRLLKKEGLVYCLNEDYYRPRLYRVTEKGKKKIIENS